MVARPCRRRRPSSLDDGGISGLFSSGGPSVRFRKSEKELPALAAQLRAFSSLLSLPSQAQSVIKAFRRQGIGSADVFNTARFLLSRLESLSAAPTSLSFLRFRSKSSKSSEGGQSWPLRAQWRDCVLCSAAPQIPQTRLTHASALGRSWFLV